MEKFKKKIKNKKEKLIKWVKKNPQEFIFLVVLLFVSAILRLYRIDEYLTFLGDEGRDVIVVRRLLVYFDPILVGPGTSIGNMYLGPLYYYMMAPALLLARYSPVGPAVQIALLGVATVFFVWDIARKWFGKWAGVIAASLYAVSPTIIIYSRSSWNPNIMPFFALLTVYAAWKMWFEKKPNWFFVSGVSFAFVLQSHYLGLLLAPVVGLFWFLTFLKVKKDKEKKGTFLKKTALSLVIFALLMSPLVIFDARHDWRNMRAMGDFFTKRQTTVSARPWKALPVIPKIAEEISVRLVGARDLLLGQFTILTLSVFAFFVFLDRKKIKKIAKSGYLAIFIWLLPALIGLGLYKQQIYDHYYGFFFAAPFLLFGGLSQEIVERLKGKTKILAFIPFLAILVFNLMKNPLSEEPNRQLPRTIEVAEKIKEEAGGEKYNLAVIAERNYEDAYKYFLLLWDEPVVDIDTQLPEETITDQLFVVCEYPQEKCQPTSNPKAGIAHFGWSKIDEVWEVGGTFLYKLGHAR